ncbi:hypothetical protein Q3A66_17255 [Hymenobacter sp. BT770]|uniref:hypothetical protein n=1 Tax=Hymenobacter sp. BT770 TaxID=2886942 RepID=UPI001D1089AD|nr:hypothetical protein [Hymenobacter sp. BT770]MCC3154806.1 hypothetical protein [Hymenobacter sp. BT770]MDO3416819.1 hypothetical protein [Hymenobacter sp. BT770]
MADHPTLSPRLGHFLPYLLLRRLRAVAWPDSGGERAVFLLILVLTVLYGAGFGLLLNSSTRSDKVADLLPALLIGFNAMLLVSALLIDFVPTLRPVVRAVPEHFPVSARLNVVTAFLLDFITLRRLTIVAGLLTALAVAPRHAQVPGFGLLLVLGAATLSFNFRLLVALRRWRHPLLGLHAASLLLMCWWLSQPQGPHHAALGVGMALLPWVLWAAQLYWLGPYFSARYLPAEAGTASAPSQVLAHLSPEWKVYARKAWLPLLMGLVFKVLMVGVGGYMLGKEGRGPHIGFFSVFFMAFQPAIGFTYVNNNLFGFLSPLVGNELQRLGLTRRILLLYARLVGPVVLVDCLLSAALLLGLFPAMRWQLLGLLPLAAVAFTSVGLWGSLYQAKPVVKAVDFANMRNNTSTLMSFCTIAFAMFLYFVPWWWLRILVAALVGASAWWPIRAVLHNDGRLRRRLWGSIGL